MPNSINNEEKITIAEAILIRKSLREKITCMPIINPNYNRCVKKIHDLNIVIKKALWVAKVEVFTENIDEFFML